MTAPDLLRARLLVAMAGETGRLGWWDAAATTATGRYVVGSLFPRTADWTGVLCALETAAAATCRRLPPTPTLHLFGLDGVTEGLLHRTLVAWRAGGPPQGVCPWPLGDGPLDLALLLARAGLPGLAGAAGPAPGPGQEIVARGHAAGPLPLGPGPELPDALVAPLVAGFVHGTRGHPVTPYLHWDR